MKKHVVLISIILFSILFLPLTVFGQEQVDSDAKQELNLAPDSKSAVLIERDTGKMLFDKNMHEQLPPASMTKVMTLLLIMEALDHEKISKDEIIRVSEQAASMGGSQVFLETGEEMSVNDLLKAIAVASANDASVALAERIAGSEKAFVEEMNKKAEALGLENTNFQNSTGLPADDHYSTAYDMAVMAKELLKYESITDYTSIYDDYLRKGEENEFWLVNTNKLIKSYPGADGLKTGYTNEAKYCLTATGEKEGMRVIAVAMGAETTKERNADITKMFDYAFNHFETNNLYDKGEMITSLEFLKAEEASVDAVASESVSTIHRKGEADKNITTSVKLSDNVELPLSKGDQVGELIIKNNGQVLTQTPLVADHDVKKATYITLLKRTMQKMVN
ncbi:D-Ala-D-Ala carboxypeptidase DacF. Serine peptidase. MEROPS family S11 [Lentibacillus persicus]|uniref:serine-type D-Ala-D-Ala carboxypeptidase n=1 Tax=Lentibacillus persicus TaxID=640948 RepID=A0A1I1SYX6_9BACI|nr:D-alanyl-D-alanine carboxypeptidase family protein [Lentibacillus persicus]SFD51659.1 D-Ala-D-Ala carboxypeptidase DacF. Serine peptidase. MEROPS family S11 [Lentibacillus persicus]